MKDEKGFFWEPCPELEALLLKIIEDLKKQNSTIVRIEQKLLTGTSSRLLDWVDHLLLPDTTHIKDLLSGLGFLREPNPDFVAYYHPAVLLPSVVLSVGSSGRKRAVALRVESISDFLQLNGLRAEIEGKPFSGYRRCCVSTESGTSLLVVERRGTRNYKPTYPADEHLLHYLEAVESWKSAPRFHADEETAFSGMLKLADDLSAKLGPDLAAQVVCSCERDYWLSRNYAARVQKMRQDTLGLGWANHDHHTFRSSRRNFSKLVELFTRLGFEKRERFYAGEEAGWGAQVMENAVAGLVLFLDVDLAPEEVAIDFGSVELKERDTLGTVGLWSALHGDSILGAGMHHLAARFMFHRLPEDVAEMGVEFMAPFSDLPYLKQAFSKGESWPVNLQRVQSLLDARRIEPAQADRFLSHGAIGSHLENIQRRDGYKGFSRTNVSKIIRETDPRS